jgi:excinuclease ABC subunit C
MLTPEMIADVPSDPGVYFFWGASGEILYIGKAKCLRKRVRSYLHKVKRRPNKIKRLIRWTTDVRYQVCRSEQEALFLESRLIQEYQPTYNTAMKYGRRFWYIRIDIGEDFPRLERVSETQPDGARYFGPLSSRRWTDEAIDVLQRIFPIRTCEGEITPIPGFRPCFQYELKRCDAPCAALVIRELYGEMITDIVNLLDGEYEKVQTSLVTRRDSASEVLQFERAAAFHKQLQRIQKVFTFLDVHRKVAS